MKTKKFIAIISALVMVVSLTTVCTVATDGMVRGQESKTEIVLSLDDGTIVIPPVDNAREETSAELDCNQPIDETEDDEM
ncbi:MAG: hypothetical protein LUH56_00150 [Oscillospiraceae bacterium]|nr:hypothetical protein [Oscillospiraceae bacterium]MCD7848229.1 hypothetical protein [Oscillospiraceae bacterium]